NLANISTHICSLSSSTAIAPINQASCLPRSKKSAISRAGFTRRAATRRRNKIYANPHAVFSPSTIAGGAQIGLKLFLSWKNFGSSFPSGARHRQRSRSAHGHRGFCFAHLGLATAIQLHIGNLAIQTRQSGNRLTGLAFARQQRPVAPWHFGLELNRRIAL